MIERITGKLIEKSPTHCLIDCHGLGLGLHISLNTFQQLEAIPAAQPASLYSYLHVREDVLQLYGFYERHEKTMFEMLITISGVGPKLTILSGINTDELDRAIRREDVGMLTRIPGVGKKTAQRLILELKEKIQKQADTFRLTSLAGEGVQPHDDLNEAVMALISLGFKEANAHRAIVKVTEAAEGKLSLEELIKRALKEM